MKIEKWTIIPQTAPAVSRNCPGCRRKTAFRSSGNFRINANGSKIDIWLIYRCENCGTSWNMDIYERVSPGSLDAGLYESFQKNDRETAMKYGCSREILSRNKAEALWEQTEYKVEVTETQASVNGRTQECSDGRKRIIICNQNGLPLRLDKLLCGHFGWSRKEAVRMEESGQLCICPAGRGCGPGWWNIWKLKFWKTDKVF